MSWGCVIGCAADFSRLFQCPKHMKLVIIRHRLLPGAAETALARINVLSERMRTQPGYCFRHVGTEAGDESCITSVTAWATASDCAAWEAHLAASPLPKVERLYSSVEHISVDADGTSPHG
ncbi:antibiotic biosynthesis monooxygenase family protein [Paraburkholderia xenovorans LB400]|nr:antibiotic biosynthesis monooxygenase [Paraburkholderia xenovorans]AIP37261.1 antibiotic biosynthesis monooxygenase family protein [Paraburkholderia xenovorans LB400]